MPSASPSAARDRATMSDGDDVAPAVLFVQPLDGGASPANQIGEAFTSRRPLFGGSNQSACVPIWRSA